MYEILITEFAEQDLDGIVGYIAAKLANPPAAGTFLDNVEASYKIQATLIGALVGALLLAGCARYPSKAPLQRAMQQHDPSSLTLEAGYNDYVRRAFLSDRTEIGIIQIKDGSTSKYWFRSHHLVDDIGGTWFQMSD